MQFVAIRFLMLMLTSHIVEHAADLESYGKYKVEVTNFTLCPGSKLRSNIDVNATWVKNLDGTDDIFMTADIKKPVGPLGMRMKVFKLTNNGYQLTVEYRVKNMCSHFLAQEALKYMPKVDSNCYLQKEHVHYEMRDYNHLVHIFLGDQFFYGRYLKHVDYSSPREGIVCNNFHVSIVQAK